MVDRSHAVRYRGYQELTSIHLNRSLVLCRFPLATIQAHYLTSPVSTFRHLCLRLWTRRIQAVPHTVRWLISWCRVLRLLVHPRFLPPVCLPDKWVGSHLEAHLRTHKDPVQDTHLVQGGDSIPSTCRTWSLVDPKAQHSSHKQQITFQCHLI